MKLEFIEGKGISTKDISSGCITAHFVVPDGFDASSHFNRPLDLTLDGGVQLDCSISNEGSGYYYNGTHKTFAVKLDIILPDIRAMGLVFASKELDLKVGSISPNQTANVTKIH